MTDPMVTVEGVPCPHGGEHPGGHVVSLKPKLGLQGAVYARQQIIDVADSWNLVQAALAEAYVRFGVAEIDGKKASPEDIEALLADETSSIMLAERGDELYSASILAPFVRKTPASSPGSQTESSTSPPTDGSPKRQKRSKPSSTSTTPTDSTAMTSDEPEPDSRLSPNSTSDSTPAPPA